MLPSAHVMVALGLNTQPDASVHVAISIRLLRPGSECTTLSTSTTMSEALRRPSAANATLPDTPANPGKAAASNRVSMTLFPASIGTTASSIEDEMAEANAALQTASYMLRTRGSRGPPSTSSTEIATPGTNDGNNSCYMLC